MPVTVRNSYGVIDPIWQVQNENHPALVDPRSGHDPDFSRIQSVPAAFVPQDGALSGCASLSAQITLLIIISGQIQCICITMSASKTQQQLLVNPRRALCGFTGRCASLLGLQNVWHEPEKSQLTSTARAGYL